VKRSQSVDNRPRWHKLSARVLVGIAALALPLGAATPANALPWVLYGNYSTEAYCQEVGRNLIHYMPYKYRDYRCILDAPSYWRLWVELTNY
jgi:hypothetical protein